MDFCTLTDFFDHILPHIRGKVAQTINKARGQIATLVGTGSTMAVDITATNRQAAETTHEQVRRVVENIRTTTERSVVAEAIVPVTLQAPQNTNSVVTQCITTTIASERKRKHEEILTRCRTIEQGLYAIQINHTDIKAGITQTNLQQRVEQVQGDFPESYIESGNPTRLETKLFDHPKIKTRRKTVLGKSGRKYTEVFQLDEILDAEQFEEIAKEMERERQQESGDSLATRQLELEFEKIRAETERERNRLEFETRQITEREKIRADLELKKAVLELCRGDCSNGVLDICKLLLK